MPPRAKTDRQKGDVTAAYKVISSGLVELSRAEMIVANAILRHVGASDDTCFPSLERLAAMSKIDARSVRRATQRLCTGEGRLFDKFRKTGRGKTSTANYTPRWCRFRQLEAEIEAVFMGRFEQEEDANADNSVRSNADNFVPLTPVHRTPVHTTHRATTSETPSSAAEARPKSQSEPKPKPAFEIDSIRLKVAPQAGLPVRGEKKASERWNADLLRCGSRIYGEVIEWLPEPIAEEATREERQKYHRGISFIRDKLMEAGKLELAANVSKYCLQ